MDADSTHYKNPADKPVYLQTNLQIIFGVTLMSVLGVSSITPAFPSIVQELNISAKSIGLLITAFTLPGVLLTPILGVLADRFGRKVILVPAMFLFALAGGACGFVRDFHLLLLLRFVQGIGGASLGSLNVTIIGDLYSDRRRAAAMGYNASVLSVGTASYPAIGGALALLGWYYPFFLPFLAFPLGLIVLFGLNNPEPKNEQKMGEYLSKAWQSIRQSQVIVLFIASIITFIILYGPFLTYFPILAGHDFHASSLVIGLLMSSMSLSTAITSSQLGKLTRRYSKRTLLQAAFAFYGVGLLIMPLIPNIWLFLIPTLIFGIGHGINIPSIQTLLAELAPLEYRAAFMSLNGMVPRLGQTLGPVIMVPIFVGWGIGGVYSTGAGLAVLMISLLVVLK